MGIRFVALTVIIGLLLAATSSPVAAGFEAGKGADAGCSECEQSGPPEFARAMVRLGATVMAQERVRVRNCILDSDLPPVIKAGRVLIPVRAVTMALGATVEWDQDERKITITRDDTTIVLYLDDMTFFVNGEPHELDVPGQILANRMFVPLRFIAQALGERVKWNPAQGTVSIGDDD